MKVHFDYFDGDPDTIDTTRDKSRSGKGHILDISRGGIFIATNNRVSVNMPVRVEFRTASRKLKLEGTVVRTGLMRNNPSKSPAVSASLKSAKTLIWPSSSLN